MNEFLSLVHTAIEDHTNIQGEKPALIFISKELNDTLIKEFETIDPKNIGMVKEIHDLFGIEVMMIPTLYATDKLHMKLIKHDKKEVMRDR